MGNQRTVAFQEEQASLNQQQQELFEVAHAATATQRNQYQIEIHSMHMDANDLA